MDLVTLLLLAVGLSMDAFAVSVSSGILMCHTKWTKSVKLAGAFGLFQGLMPVIGYVIAHTFAHQIEAFDHWIAFGLLVFIGGKMLWEVLRGGDGDDIPKGDPTDWKNLLVMAIATSIDAMAVGVTMALAGRGCSRRSTVFCSAASSSPSSPLCSVSPGFRSAAGPAINTGKRPKSRAVSFLSASASRSCWSICWDSECLSLSSSSAYITSGMRL